MFDALVEAGVEDHVRMKRAEQQLMGWEGVCHPLCDCAFTSKRASHSECSTLHSFVLFSCMHSATNLQYMCASCISHATKRHHAHARLHSLAPLFASQTPLGSSAHLRRLQHREM